MSVIFECLVLMERKDSPTAQKIKFSIKVFFSKCDQIRKNMRIWSHLLKILLMENFIFCAVPLTEALHAKIQDIQQK